MASSKSTIKSVDKVRLFFNKYSYKASITTHGIYWIKACESMVTFHEFVNQRYSEWESNKERYPYGWYRQPKSLAEHDLDLIEYLINLKDGLKTSDIKFRHEYETFSLYTNDEALIKRLNKHDARWRIEKAIPSPNGVKYFKKDPPAKFRAYFTANKIGAEFTQEMIDYLNRTADLTPSLSLYEWLRRRNKYNGSYVWLNSYHYIDYNDEKNLMMMHLLFPGAIGKTYKLEKKPK